MEVPVVFEALGSTAMRPDGEGEAPATLRLLWRAVFMPGLEGGLALSGSAQTPAPTGELWGRRDWVLGEGSVSLLLGLSHEPAAAMTRGGLTLRGSWGDWGIDLGLGNLGTTQAPSRHLILGHRRTFDEGDIRHELLGEQAPGAGEVRVGWRSGLSWRMGPGPVAGLSLGAEAPVERLFDWRLTPRLSLAW